MKKNPSNPYSNDSDQIKRSVSMPTSKATVETARSSTENGFHVVTVSVDGDSAPFDAPVLPPSIGSAYIPREGEKVALMFGPRDKPWVVGPWYALDENEDESGDMPEYEAGELVLGNHTGSHIRIDNSGDIHLNSGGGDVYINGTKQ